MPLHFLQFVLIIIFIEVNNQFHWHVSQTTAWVVSVSHYTSDTHCFSTLLAHNALLLHVTLVAEDHLLHIFISMLERQHSLIMTLHL